MPSARDLIERLEEAEKRIDAYKAEMMQRGSLTYPRPESAEGKRHMADIVAADRLKEALYPRLLPILRAMTEALEWYDEQSEYTNTRARAALALLEEEDPDGK